MKIKTTFSVVIRVVIWIFLLFGASLYSLKKDWNNPLFSSLLFHSITFFIGIILLRLSFKAAANGGKELAKYGRKGDIPRLETNQLVSSGVYSCSRHPMLFGLTLLPLAVAFILGSPTFITTIAPLEMLFIVIMVLTLEEKECKVKYSKAYEEYAKTTPIFPKNLQCLKKIFS